MYWDMLNAARVHTQCIYLPPVGLLFCWSSGMSLPEFDFWTFLEKRREGNQGLVVWMTAGTDTGGRKETTQQNALCSIAVRYSIIKKEARVFLLPQMYFVWLGHMVCLPSHYLSCLKHLHTGNKDSQGNVSCKSLRDVNGGLDKGKLAKLSKDWGQLA